VSKFSGFIAGAIVAGVGLLAGGASAQSITSQQVISGIANPVWVTNAPGDYSRIFVCEQRQSGGVASAGAVKIYGLPNYNLIGTFVTQTVATGDEQGLLGLAFHPNYATNGKVYIYYTTSGADNLAVFQRNPGNPNQLLTPGTIIFTQSDPATNHNGGWLKFGPDGYLYLSIGDGGGANDSGTGHNATIGNGQDLNTCLGKILRFDVDGNNGPGGLYGIPPTNPFAGSGDPNIRKEIWAYGVRNPWRNDFDPATGDLYIADVGQNIWEEIDVQPADINGNMGGRNYGWRCFESDVSFNSNGGLCPAYGVNNVPILLKYGHSSAVAPTNLTGCSITGGMVYRGCAIPGLQGTYFFADYCNRWFFSVRANVAANTFSAATNWTSSLQNAGMGGITSFGRDAYGEIYITAGHNTTAGTVWKIVRNGGTAPADCNANGRPDCQEIMDGSVADANNNTIPDTCEAPFAMALMSPAPNATGVSLTPTLTWGTSSNAATYGVKVATDAGLTNVVASASGLGTLSYNVPGGALSNGQTYYWGATATNANGTTNSVPFSQNFTTIAPPPCPGDINGDGQRNTADLTQLLGAFGTCRGDPNYNDNANLDAGDACINTSDLVALLGVFGVPCP